MRIVCRLCAGVLTFQKVSVYTIAQRAIVLSFAATPGLNLDRVETRKAKDMNKILEEIKSEHQHEDQEWSSSERDDIYEPEKWCSFLRHEVRLADRAACSLATDEITGNEEQSLVVAYRARLIKIAALAIAATQSLDRVMEKRRKSSNKEGDLAKRSQARATRRLK